MKYTANLSSMFFETKAKQDININFKMEGISVSLEFGPDEFITATKSLLDLKCAAGDISERIIPIVKDAIVEIVKTISGEIQNYRKFKHDLYAKDNKFQGDSQPN